MKRVFNKVLLHKYHNLHININKVVMTVMTKIMKVIYKLVYHKENQTFSINL